MTDILSKENLDKISLAMDEYEKTVIGLGPISKIEAPKYLTMNIPELRKKSIQELAEAGYELAQYGLFVLRTINKERGWERWAESKLDEAVATALPDVPQRYGFNQAELVARNTPEICKKLNAFLREIRMKINRLYGVCDQIKFISDCLRDIRFAYGKGQN